ncbi:ABC transporter substrate-binding protein [Tistlia consotensis]|nr:spermidine/putrescine ABC transporter substrate-binding protein [Tistlia consotensis]
MEALSRRRFMTGAAAVGVSFAALPKGVLAAEEPKLNFYNWDTYIGETTLADFKEATGIEVSMSLFADNAELFARFKEGNPGFDVIVPTNDYAERMIKAGILEELDHSKIPNMKNLAPAFQDAAFDPGRKHTMPYMWGTMGLGYRKSKVDGVPGSWKAVLESDKYKGRIALLSEGRTMLGMAAKYLGYSLNTGKAEEIKAAEELLIKQKPNIKVFAQDNGQDLLLSGEVDITVEWNGDILQVMAEDDDLSYVVPQEGSLLWQDTLCIPKGAPHPDNAHKFINYILDAKAGAAIADFIQYATPNAAARKLLGPDYNNNPAIFPTDETIARCEPQTYQGEAVQRLYEEAWTRVQAA